MTGGRFLDSLWRPQYACTRPRPPHCCAGSGWHANLLAEKKLTRRDGTPLSRQMIGLRVCAWLAAAGGFASALALLSVSIKNDPFPSQDRTVLDRVSGWDFPGLEGYFEFSNMLTDSWALVGFGLAGFAFLWFSGLRRQATSYLFGGVIVALLALVSDYAIGNAVGRSYPTAGGSGTSFPSGHVFGGTVAVGLLVFLAAHYRLERALLVPLIVLSSVIAISAGLARIHSQVHWPSDVAAGYLLAALWLLVLVPLTLGIEKAGWVPGPPAQCPLRLDMLKRPLRADRVT